MKVAIIRGGHPSAYLREDYATTWLRCEEDKILARNMLRICFSKALAVVQGKVYDDLQNRDVMERWTEVLEGIRGNRQKHQADRKPTKNPGVALLQEADLPDMTRLTINEG
jgi:hypothetical protein